MNNYTDSQLEIILQYVKEENIDEIETMAYGAWVALDGGAVSKLEHYYKIVWLHDDPYEVHLIPKNIVFESML